MTKFLIFEDEKSCEYIHKKAAICKNSDINTFQYIPPQLYKRFSDLSKLTFIARKSDPRLKTKIILGDSDLVLKTKLKDTTEWEIEPDLESFGEITNIDTTINWPTIEVKSITSPPKGRTRKNVHNMSDSSLEGNSPINKKSRMEDDIIQKVQDNQKVQDFVKKLEAKQAKKPKYTQSKLVFPSRQISPLPSTAK